LPDSDSTCTIALSEVTVSADLQELVRQMKALSPEELRRLRQSIDAIISEVPQELTGTPASPTPSMPWVQPKLPLWLRTVEAIRGIVGAPKSLAALNYEQRANEACLQERSALNTLRLTGRRHL
jgi:hypothetical protein